MQDHTLQWDTESRIEAKSSNVPFQTMLEAMTDIALSTTVESVARSSKASQHAERNVF